MFENRSDDAKAVEQSPSQKLLDESSDLQKSEAVSNKGKVLVVLSSADKLDLANGTAHSTGFYLNELGVPLKAMVDAGYEPVFSNPLGNKPTMDKGSVNKDYFSGSELELQTIKKFVESQKGLSSPIPLKTVAEGNLDQFKAVFVPGQCRTSGKTNHSEKYSTISTTNKSRPHLFVMDQSHCYQQWTIRKIL